MIERIALTGSIYSGKSTLARYLEQEQGYMRINFTGLLKQYASKALASCGVPTPPEYIESAKKQYRPFLQELGEVLGFSYERRYVVEALTAWASKDYPRVVFDNVRTDAQFAVLREYGFRLVEIFVSRETQVRRAAQAGVKPSDLDVLLNHPIEQPLTTTPYAILNGANSPVTNFRFLLGEKEYSSKTA